MRILLTGATGFIGNRLCRQLLARGHEVVCLGRRPIRGRLASHANIKQWLVEKTACINASDAPGGGHFDRVYHLAAAGVAPVDNDPLQLVDANIAFGARLLREITAPAFVFAGSSAEYAPKATHAPFVESDALTNTGLYGASKAAGGLYHVAMAHSADIPLAHLRLFHVYGAGEKAHRLTTSLFHALISGKRVALSSGEQIRDFLDVDDVAKAFEAVGVGLASGSLPTGAYNVSSGEGVKVRTVCEEIALILGADKSLLGFGDIPLRPNELPFVVGDGSALAGAIGWRPSVSLKCGLRRLRDEIFAGDGAENGK
jgi:nucleoside-diphosphate-sugar epimerase